MRIKNLRYSPESIPIGTPSQTQVSCSTGYQLVECSGWGLFNTLNGYWSSNDICFKLETTPFDKAVVEGEYALQPNETCRMIRMFNVLEEHGSSHSSC